MNDEATCERCEYSNRSDGIVDLVFVFGLVFWRRMRCRCLLLGKGKRKSSLSPKTRKLFIEKFHRSTSLSHRRPTCTVEALHRPLLYYLHGITSGVAGLSRRLMLGVRFVMMKAKRLHIYFYIAVGYGSNKKRRKGFSVVWLAYIWAVWKARNDRVFNNVVFDASVFTDKLIEAEELLDDQKGAFKEFVKEMIQEAKRANREI
ncbi:soyasapogenol B glucuronide galactosyltransferase [Trifolium repens]|nr:soyasapogenol B glucuronide galactosyltransferase [Trifolium repens]